MKFRRGSTVWKRTGKQGMYQGEVGLKMASRKGFSDSAKGLSLF